jgi:ketosteroid isomerase-like protein
MHMKSSAILNVFFTIFLAAICNPCRAEDLIAPTQVDRTFAVYGKAWAEPDALKRAEYLIQVWAKDGQYKDPSVAPLTGVEALSRHIGEFIRQYPKAKFTKTSKLDAYGTTFRADWFLDFGDGKTPALTGFDFGELNSEGKIAKIAGFFGALRNAESVKNEAIVAKYLTSLFTKFDYAGLDSVLAADAVYTQAAGLPYGGVYIGLTGMMKMFRKSSEYSGMVVVDGPTLTTNSLTKKVIASFTVRSTAKKSGKILDMAIQESFELKGDKIVGITPFYFDTKTFTEFLNEPKVGPAGMPLKE